MDAAARVIGGASMTVFHRNEKRGELPASLRGGVIAIGIRLAVVEPRISAALLFAGSFVPRSVFDALLTADSVGQFFQEHIRDVYPYERIR